MKLFKGLLYAGLASAILLALSSGAARAGSVTFVDLSGTLADPEGPPDPPASVTLTGLPGATATNIGGETFLVTIPNAVATTTGSNDQWYAIFEVGTTGPLSDFARFLTFANSGTLLIELASDINGVPLLPPIVAGPFGTAAEVLLPPYNPVPLPGFVANNLNPNLGGLTVTIQSGVVPEPGSLALLGIGMTGFLAFRRFFKKTSVA
jgi:hypothetical protein